MPIDYVGWILTDQTLACLAVVGYHDRRSPAVGPAERWDHRTISGSAIAAVTGTGLR